MKLLVFKNERRGMRILLVGLEAVGKSTILYKLQLGEILITTPTVGFSVKTVEFRKFNFISWDLGVQDGIRPLCKEYYHNIQALVFVIDSYDKDKIQEANEELQKMLREDELRDATLLVFANKQDKLNAMSVSEITDKLRLHSIPSGRRWNIQGACAITGQGLYDGFDWLSTTLGTSYI